MDEGAFLLSYKNYVRQSDLDSLVGDRGSRRLSGHSQVPVHVRLAAISWDYVE